VYLAELRASGDWPFVLDLHPRLTIVAGLGRERSHRLAGLVNGAVCGRLDDLEGLAHIDQVEHHLTSELLAALGVPPDLNIVVSAADLPGARPLGDEGEHAAPAPPTPPPPADEPEESAELADARVALFQAREARTGAELALAAARASLDPDAPAAMIDAENALEAARRSRDEAASLVRAAQAALDAAQAEALAEQASFRDDIEHRRSALEHRRQEVLAALDNTPTTDPTPVAQALAELRRIEALPPQPVDEALALADAWAVLQERRAALPPPRSAPAALVRDALEALEQARLDYAQAQEAARMAHLTPHDIAEIEHMHAAVVEASEKVEGKRVAGPMARRRLEAAQAAEAEVLERLGLPSYHAFLLRTAPGLSTPIEGERLDRAHAALIDAEAVWEELHAPAPDDHEAQALNAETAQLRAEVIALLGGDPGGDVEGALRALRRPAADPEPARDSLRAALEGVGSTLEPEGDLAATAAAWLAYADEDHARRAALQAELGGLESDIELLAAQAEDGRAPSGDEASGAATSGESGMPVQVRTRLEAELDQARAALDASTDHEEVARRARNQASGRLENARSSELRVASLTEELSGATAAHAQATARVEELERTEAARRVERNAAVPAPADNPEPDVDISGVDVDELEVYLLARLVAQRSVGEAGSLPLVIDDAFSGLPVETIERALAVLERFTPAFQFIFLSDDPELEAWARLFGPKGASVRRFSSAQSVSAP
jgi:hypothetical protein